MIITKLNKEEYAGKKFILKYFTKGYFDIEKTSEGFFFTYKTFEKVTQRSFEDYFFNEWLEDPVAYGAFENGKLLGYVEGTPEAWNHRYRISNICIFDEKQRHCGIGSKLINALGKAG